MPPPHLLALVDICYKKPIDMKVSEDMTLVEIYDAVPANFEAWFAYQEWRAFHRCELRI